MKLLQELLLETYKKGVSTYSDIAKRFKITNFNYNDPRINHDYTLQFSCDILDTDAEEAIREIELDDPSEYIVINKENNTILYKSVFICVDVEPVAYSDEEGYFGGFQLEFHSSGRIDSPDGLAGLVGVENDTLFIRACAFEFSKKCVDDWDNYVSDYYDY